MISLWGTLCPVRFYHEVQSPEPSTVRHKVQARAAGGAVGAAATVDLEHGRDGRRRCR